TMSTRSDDDHVDAGCCGMRRDRFGSSAYEDFGGCNYTVSRGDFGCLLERDAIVLGWFVQQCNVAQPVGCDARGTLEQRYDVHEDQFGMVRRCPRYGELDRLYRRRRSVGRHEDLLCVPLMMRMVLRTVHEAPLNGSVSTNDPLTVRVRRLDGIPDTA